MFKLRFDDAGSKVWMLPQDVIDNTIRAFSVSPTSASGYAGRNRRPAATSRRRTAPTASRSTTVRITVTAACGRWCDRTDVPAALTCASRSGPARRPTDFEFAVEMLNAFNQANFVPVGVSAARRPTTKSQP